MPNPQQSRAYNNKWMTFDALREIEFEEEQFLVDKLLVPEGKLMMVGGPKKGKSLLAQQLIHTAARVGLPGAADNYLGFKIPRALRTMYLQYEVTVRMMQNRIVQQGTKLGHDFVHAPLVLNKPDRETPIPDLVAAGVQKMGHAPDIVVIDPLTLTHFLDENNAQEMRKLTDQFDQVIDTFGCGLVIVHHARKDNGHSPKGLEQARGSIQLTAWPNSILTLNAKGQAGRELSFDLRDAQADAMVLEFDNDSLTFTKTGKVAMTMEYLDDRLREGGEWEGFSRKQVVAAAMAETGLSQSVVYKRLSSLGFDKFFD